MKNKRHQPKAAEKNALVKLPKWSGRVHAVAELLPMLDEDELTDLASDIKVNGLRNPLTLDANGVLIDGRNRRIACERAGVEASYVTLPDDVDPMMFILSQNIHRRHLTKGQQAMFVMKAVRSCPESGQTIRKIAGFSGISKTRLGMANVVLETAPDIADLVIAGAYSLDEAIEIVS
jgi:hypothetical protein